MARVKQISQFKWNVWVTNTFHMTMNFLPLVEGVKEKFKYELAASKNTRLVHWNFIFHLWGIYDLETGNYELVDWDTLRFKGSMMCAFQVPKLYPEHRPNSVVVVFNYERI